MDKRYQVFISSTYTDLQEERQEVIQALLELDCIPAGMELFPAANDTQWEIIKKVITDCDYYIVILAGRYGSLSTDGYSYTEKEYDFAIASGKPVLAFLNRDPGKIITKKSEATDEGKAKLNDFREKLLKRLCKTWDSPTELGSVVSRSMVQLIKASPAIGWVKADKVADLEATNEILILRNRVKELETEMKDNTDRNKKEIEKLSRGAERIEVKYSFNARDKNHKTTSWTGTFTPSWNEIIASVFPVCIDEAKESIILQQFNQFIEKESLELLQKDKRLKDNWLSNFQVELNDFHTIIIQLRALQILKKSTKGKSVKDSATYWSLTELGDEQLVLLRAIRSRKVKAESSITKERKD